MIPAPQHLGGRGVWEFLNYIRNMSVYYQLSRRGCTAMPHAAGGPQGELQEPPRLMFPPHPQSFCALPSSLFCMVLSLLRHLPLGSVCSIASTPWGPPLGSSAGETPCPQAQRRGAGPRLRLAAPRGAGGGFRWLAPPASDKALGTIQAVKAIWTPAVVCWGCGGEERRVDAQRPSGPVSRPCLPLPTQGPACHLPLSPV